MNEMNKQILREGATNFYIVEYNTFNCELRIGFQTPSGGPKELEVFVVTFLLVEEMHLPTVCDEGLIFRERDSADFLTSYCAGEKKDHRNSKNKAYELVSFDGVETGYFVVGFLEDFRWVRRSEIP